MLSPSVFIDSMEKSHHCQQCNTVFVINSQDLVFYQKIDVPLPTLCPRCRLIRRLIWRNERALYRRKCSSCGKAIIALYSKDKPWKVYCPPCYYSEAWDPMAYGREYDFSKPFFAQFKEFMLAMPWPSLAVDWQTLINSAYNNQASNLKNCYLLSHAGNDEGCLYSSALKFSKDSSDIALGQFCELSYEGVNLFKCYRVFFSQDCENCNDVWFSKNLFNCSNCFSCANLRNKQYYIFNKPYSKEEYQKKISKYNFGSYQDIKKLLIDSSKFFQRFPQKYIHGRHNEKVSGDYIYESKNVFSSFEIIGAQNCKYCQFLDNKGNFACYDYTDWGANAQFVYESVLCGDGMNRIKFCYNAFNECQDVEYSLYPQFSSSYLFGCIGLKGRKHCILNIQYTKEEYETLRTRIIEHMNKAPYIDGKGRTYRYGEFFPPALSLFAYNETTAQEYFPLTKEGAKNIGYFWKNPEKSLYQTTISASQLPDDIKDADDAVLNEIIQCGNCEKAYRIIKPELQLYKRLILPLPRQCPSCRHQARILKKGPLELYSKKCAQCGAPIQTSYSLESNTIVWCESCYRKDFI